MFRSRRQLAQETAIVTAPESWFRHLDRARNGLNTIITCRFSDAWKIRSLWFQQCQYVGWYDVPSLHCSSRSAALYSSSLNRLFSKEVWSDGMVQRQQKNRGLCSIRLLVNCLRAVARLIPVAPRLWTSQDSELGRVSTEKDTEWNTKVSHKPASQVGSVWCHSFMILWTFASCERHQGFSYWVLSNQCSSAVFARGHEGYRTWIGQPVMAILHVHSFLPDPTSLSMWMMSRQLKSNSQTASDTVYIYTGFFGGWDSLCGKKKQHNRPWNSPLKRIPVHSPTAIQQLE